MAFFGKTIIWLTGDEHNETGHITEDPETRDEMLEKRMKKVNLILKTIPEDEQVQVFGDDNPQVTLLSWGSNKGVILDALDQLRKEGIRGNLVYVKLMNPFPSGLVSKYLSGSKLIINLENNYTGQLALLVRQNCGIKIENSILKYNGRHPTQDEVYRSIKKIINNEEKTVVMTSGA
jgi:2-oxoglutarate ferredoxin oxidoreductase subunit alpha